MIFVIGSQGRLGQEIVSSYDGNVIAPKRHVYELWWQEDYADTIFAYFEKRATTGSVIFITAGLLNPQLSQEQHLRVNYLLPKNIIESVRPLGIKVITFGSIMETLISKKNKYVISKSMLGEYINSLKEPLDQTLHIRIHTLYGSAEPSPFMFLGQLNHALVTHTPFLMSSGEQLREYHHINDDVVAIRKIVEAGCVGIFNLNHGKPLSLKEIANHIFNAFNASDLLQVGALPNPEEENYSVLLQRPPEINGVKFRDTLSALVTYLKECAEYGKGT